MERIAKTALTALIALLATILIFFGICVHFDGFEATLAVFSKLLPPLFDVAGVFDWIKAIGLSLIIAAVVEILIGCRLKRKSVRVVVDLSSFIIALIGLIALF